MVASNLPWSKVIEATIVGSLLCSARIKGYLHHGYWFKTLPIRHLASNRIGGSHSRTA
jgi:hypothetical protein